MKTIVRQNSFKKDFKNISKQPNFKKNVFEYVISTLQRGENLPEKFKPHKMTASGVVYQGFWNCHVAPNICMIYGLTDDTLTLVRIGSHNKLGLTEEFN